MYKIICYNYNELFINSLYNHFLEEFNEIKKNKNISSYLLINNKTIYGIFSYKYNNNKIDIVLFKTVNALEYYTENFIYIIFKNIILEFDYVYLNKNKIYPKYIILGELHNYELIEENEKLILYKKKNRYNYFNCLFY